MGFKKINEDISSDTVLAVLGLFRKRLPCSGNFWRYKRNYDMHQKKLQEDQKDSPPLSPSLVKRVASPKMSHIRSLSPYS